MYSGMQTRTKTGSLTKIKYRELERTSQKEGTSTTADFKSNKWDHPRNFIVGEAAVN